MPSYATLDAIADAFNPLAGLAALGLVASPLFRRGWALAGRRAVALGLLLAVTYALMGLDRLVEPHHDLALGYSTHSAFAVAAAAFGATALPRWRIAWITATVLYLGLIVYQGYHPVGDVVLSAALLLGAAWLLLRRNPHALAGGPPRDHADRLARR